MHIRNKRSIWSILSVLFFFMIAAYLTNTYFNFVPTQPDSGAKQANDSLANAGYVTIRDANGKVILQTGLSVSPEDEYISEDNTHYVVVSVEGENAIAQAKQEPSLGNQSSLSNMQSQPAIPAVAANKPIHVVIYHTHTDESYIPDSGTDLEPWNGDILEVGTTFSNALRKSGVSVNHNSNRHDPHDIHAYGRSRRTVAQLIKEAPDAVFDLHRDSAPTEAYITSVNGIDIGRVMIVVGRTNPNMRANLQFAKQVKGAADDIYPGLMRGIFIGRGDYNQDLYPSALLFEIGSQSTALGDADKAVNCLADAVLTVLNQR